MRFPLPQGLSVELAQTWARAATGSGMLPAPPPASPTGAEPRPKLEKMACAFRKQAEKQRVEVAEFGIIDGTVLVAFLWKISGRPQEAPPNWRRERPLYVVLDNYSVHKGAVLQAAQPALRAAGIHLIYLPAYCPELSRIEPLWQTLKHHELPQRSFAHLGELKQAVDLALAQKARMLQEAAARRIDQ